MAHLYRGYDNPDNDLELGKRIAVEVDGEVHTGEVVRCGNTRTWGHIISDNDGERYEFTIFDAGFRILKRGE
jgi:hypothetical protein